MEPKKLRRWGWFFLILPLIGSTVGIILTIIAFNLNGAFFAATLFLIALSLSVGTFLIGVPTGIACFAIIKRREKRSLTTIGLAPKKKFFSGWRWLLIIPIAFVLLIVLKQIVQLLLAWLANQLPI